MSRLLENEYIQLQGYRCRLRRSIKNVALHASIDPGKTYGPNGWNNTIASLKADLRSTERRWLELHRLLGKPLPGPPVKIDPKFYPLRSARSLATHHASMTLTVKSFQSEQRIIEGVASTPSVDRLGDVMDPLGAKFSLPMPLLWQHKHDQPVGQVINANASKDGIAIRAKFAAVGDGDLARLIDNAWQAVKAGLVRGLSIGFRPTESIPIGNGGMRHASWDLFEISLVTIPANVDARITVAQ